MKLKRWKTLNVHGFHCDQMVGICFHVGSDCKQPEIFSEAIQAARNLFDVAENVGYHFNLVDIGGGFSGRKCSDIKKVYFYVQYS